MYGNRKPAEEPPCSTCRVEVLPANMEAFRIYMLTRGQYIMGFSGPVDINHLAIWEAIDRYGVKKPLEVFERVNMCARKAISEMMKKDKQKTD